MAKKIINSIKSKGSSITFKIRLHKKRTLISAIILIIFVCISLSLIGFNAYYWGKILPNVFVSGINVGGKTKTESIELLTNTLVKPETLVYIHKEQEFEVSSDSIELIYNIVDSVDEAYSTYRTENIERDLFERPLSLVNTKNVKLQVNLNEDELGEQLSVFAGQISEAVEYPSATLTAGGISINKGKVGSNLAIDDLVKETKTSLPYSNKLSIILNLIDPTIDDSEADSLKNRATNLSTKSIMIVTNDSSAELDGKEMLEFLAPSNDYYESLIDDFIDIAAENFERDAQNPVFVFEENRVKEFAPALDGIRVIKDELASKIIASLVILESTEEKMVEIVLPIEKTPPKISLEEVNNLGINELIGKGSSTYYGSITSRVHNIGVASRTINSTLIAPGEVFSFNNSVGDISQLTGYKQAYIIKDGQTILGDGGGVCQVSTTLFRAAMDAGLPIIDRRSHSYRVTYYEQGYGPGLDATVYSPTTDFQFKNDTSNHILIQADYNPQASSLDFEFYGTSDGRISKISEPIIMSSTPPPEDLYIDDPTKPAGEIEQIDWKAWGAKTYFDYTVTKDGEVIIDKTFYSNFKPWQAKFLRGTGPAI